MRAINILRKAVFNFCSCLVLIASVSSCTQQKATPTIAPGNSNNSTGDTAKTQPAPKEDTSRGKTPTFEQANESLHKARLLYVEVKKVFNDPASQNNSTAIESATKSVDDFQIEIDEILGNCDLLLGINGSKVHPEIPECLQHLKQTGISLKQALTHPVKEDESIRETYLQSAQKSIHAARSALQLSDSVKKHRHRN